MIESVIYHIGGFKAILQVQGLFTHFADLPLSKVCYPHSFSCIPLNHIREHSQLTLSLRELPGTPTAATALQLLHEQVTAASDAKVLCISSASFIQFPEILARLKSYLKTILPQANQEVLMTLAPQEEEFVAHLSANTLAGGCQPLPAWLQQEYQLSPGYDNCILQMHKLFGNDATHILIDNNDTSFSAELQRKIQSLLHVDTCAHISDPDILHSITLPSQAVHFLRTISHAYQMWGKAKNKPDYFSQFHRLQCAPTDQGYIFSPQVRSEIQKKFTKSNAAAARLMGRKNLFDTHNIDDTAEYKDINDAEARHIAKSMDAEFRQTLLTVFDNIPLYHQTYQMRTCKNALLNANSAPSLMVNEPKAKLSIVTLTFNHANFIEKNIQSVLKQKTNFPIQHIIADDASDDGTQKIILEYAQKYPHIIPIFQKKRVVGCGNNIHALFSMARTPYIALCDGDDYFTDPTKLQTQVDFLDQHKNCALCFHPVKVMYEDDLTREHIYPSIEALPRDRTPFYELSDLIKWNFIQTNSVMYRWRFANGLPEWFRPDCCPGDWYWHLLHAEQGKIGFINKIMSVYRRHKKGIYYLSEVDRLKHRAIAGLKEIEVYDIINGHFGGKYESILLKLVNGVFADCLMYDSNRTQEKGFEPILPTLVSKYPRFARHFLQSLKAVSAKK